MTDKPIEWKHHTLTDDEMRDLVRGVCDGRKFLSAELGADQGRMLGLVFMPVGLGVLADAPKEFVDDIGVLVGDLAKALDRGINGYPIFTEFVILHRADWDRARAAILRELERREKIEV